jgi:hypothetical protein
VQQATVRNLRAVMGILLPALANSVSVASQAQQERRSRMSALTVAGLLGQVASLAVTA